MNGWKMHAFQFNRARKEIGEKRVSEDILPMYTEGEIDVSYDKLSDARRAIGSWRELVSG